MEILEAFDLTSTLRGTAELAGCDHNTVAHWVRARDEAGGGLPVAVRPRPRIDAFAEKIDESVDRSRGRVRADVCHQRLVAMGYRGSKRTTRRAVAEAKRAWRAEHGRRTRRAAAPVCGPGAHGLLRTDAQGQLAVDDLGRRRDLLGAVGAGRRAVWARSDISELVVVHADGSRGPREVGRHQLTTPSPPNIRDEHYPARPAGALERKPKAWSVDERAFLAIAAGAALAGRRTAAGAVRFRRKLAEAARWPSCTAPRSSMAHCARRPTRGASATATWPRSSPTTTAHG